MKLLLAPARLPIIKVTKALGIAFIGLVFCLSATESNAQVTQKKEATKTPSKLVQTEPNRTYPADFPKYVETGNPEKDASAYKLAKSEWIEKNPERYKSMLVTPTSTLKVERSSTNSAEPNRVSSKK